MMALLRLRAGRDVRPSRRPTDRPKALLPALMLDAALPSEHQVTESFDRSINPLRIVQYSELFVSRLFDLKITQPFGHQLSSISSFLAHPNNQWF